ncbi:hypothetical protein ACJZ2D_001485 [Fusarium nematophilum]
MPSAHEPPLVPVPVNGSVNGTNGDARPHTPTTGMSLTEYSANPSTPSEEKRARIKQIVPEEFLLPTGYPDVSLSDPSSFGCFLGVNHQANQDCRPQYLRLIASATSRVYEACKVTPLTNAVNLSNRLECNVLLKREDEQPVFSFKLRGAYNKMAHLDPAKSWKGVVCCSAGNHAQGVAYSARKLKIPATIIMPEATPSIKHLNVARLGGHVVLHGADFDAAKEECARREKQDGLINIPPFDDPYVIAGQGTIGNELFGQPAGAMSIAGLKKYVSQNPSRDPKRTLIAVTSGANMNFDRLRFVAERATLGEGKEVLLAAQIPERPGSFAELVKSIMPHAVTEFSYRYASDDGANILIGLSLTAPAYQRSEELRMLIDRIKSGGMNVTDLSGDELAKSHIRYLVGGRSGVPDERLYMFTFPERPGALEKFLVTLRPKFNISLFQYRNYGGDVGKIVTGIQCPDDEVPELENFLREIGYPYEDCTDSTVFKTFLRT